MLNKLLFAFLLLSVATCVEYSSTRVSCTSGKASPCASLSAAWQNDTCCANITTVYTNGTAKSTNFQCYSYYLADQAPTLISENMTTYVSCTTTPIVT